MYPEDSNYGKKRDIKHDVKHFRHEISDLSTVTMFMLVYVWNVMSVTYSVPEWKKVWLLPNIPRLGQGNKRKFGMGLPNECRGVARLTDTVFV